MSQIWIGEHRLTGRRVALKFIKGHLDAVARRRLIREAQAACAIDHPAVVPVHDVVESEDGDPALVMDLLQGEPLDARLAREGTIAWPALAAMFTPVAEALAQAHALGLVHRDLKPANLFVGRDDSVRVLDFGIVKRLESLGSASTTSVEVAPVGTPIYMSPEQALGDVVDARSDVWSLGLVLYEALSGRLPTNGASFAEVLRVLFTRRIPPLRTVAPEVPAAFCALVDRMLEQDRARRDLEMSAVADVLGSLAERAVAPARSSVRGAPPRMSRPDLCWDDQPSGESLSVTLAPTPGDAASRSGEAVDPFGETDLYRMPAGLKERASVLRAEAHPRERGPGWRRIAARVGAAVATTVLVGALVSGGQTLRKDPRAPEADARAAGGMASLDRVRAD